MYKNKEVWATIGSKIVSNISYYWEFSFSEDEIFELIANDEYLLDDSQEVYGKRLIDFLKIWELIRVKIIESKENNRNKSGKTWAFTIEDYKTIYLLLDEEAKYKDAFSKYDDGRSETLEMISFFEESLIEEATLEAFLEDMLITFIYFAIEKPFGEHTIVFFDLISSAMILYKGFGPIFPTYKDEMEEIKNQLNSLIRQCTGMKIEHYNRAPGFQSCFKKLLDVSETTKLLLDAI
ncbi:hypothetical protein [Spiroplasma sp. BIUS-1]|uniref:hypothetical protein n=1 Tax=Spiroplasma sp. BIUS-1 TaxID=216964 RepID=UPI001397340E|nr:hypothetical protein [Spiroplasma sp. BIUS-1]QHX36893.1 hypothetical protein SBIUS_v1c06400 [Spiroplasma sp. BIUS-1]